MPPAPPPPPPLQHGGEGAVARRHAARPDLGVEPVPAVQLHADEGAHPCLCLLWTTRWHGARGSSAGRVALRQWSLTLKTSHLQRWNPRDALTAKRRGIPGASRTPA